MLCFRICFCSQSPSVLMPLLSLSGNHLPASTGPPPIWLFTDISTWALGLECGADRGGGAVLGGLVSPCQPASLSLWLLAASLLCCSDLFVGVSLLVPSARIDMIVGPPPPSTPRHKKYPTKGPTAPPRESPQYSPRFGLSVSQPVPFPQIT